MRDIDIERIKKLQLNIEDFSIPEKTDKERIAELEAQNKALMEYMGVTVNELAVGVYEVVKSTPTSYGDYLNPIQFEQGVEVKTGLWYTDGDSTWEAIKDGVPTSFDDSEYFDIINA